MSMEVRKFLGVSDSISWDFAYNLNYIEGVKLFAMKAPLRRLDK